MVIYQLYPRSFRDSNGDGIGDLRGIIEKLDYIERLGVDAVWLNPIFPSPNMDTGYDISDYCGIAAEYGTMEDFEELVSEMHRRGIKVILDLVLNHSSNEHPWFKESAASRDNAKRDWYIWRDGRRGGRPPNNWKAMTGGSAWKYYPETGQWLYFHFLPFQPDLNYRNAQVKKEMLDTVRFWLEKGVDGFRLDLLHALYEDPELKDNPFSCRLLPRDRSNAMIFQDHRYDLNLPETSAFAAELRKVTNEYGTERMLIGEVFGNMEETVNYCLPFGAAMHMVFLFEFTSTPFQAEKYAHVIREIETHFPAPNTPTYVLSNHDRMRFISRIDNDFKKAKLAVLMQITLRGVPFIYYGDEIGMPQHNLPMHTSHDPIARRFSFLPVHTYRRWGLSLNRDECRTPMQWNDGANAGFSADPGARPWVPLTKSFREINVASQEEDRLSLLNCYRTLISIRKTHPTLEEGALQIVGLGKLSKKCLAYSRISESGVLYVYLNFSSSSIEVLSPLQQPRLLFSTAGNTALSRKGSAIVLEGHEGILLEADEQEKDLG